MIESYLVTADVNNREPDLANLYPSGETDWSDFLTDAFEELTQDVRDGGWNIRKLCKRYSLQSSVTKTAAFTGTITTDEDNLQRLRLVINCTAKTGSGSVAFLLEGTDDDGTTYETVTTLSVTATGDTNVIFTKVYKKYRLSITGFTTITSMTYSAYLVETTFERLHLYKTLEMIWRIQNRLTGDVYADKEAKYKTMYDDKLTSTQFAYDEDDDGEISDTEEETNNQDITFRV
ncbi:MAG: hypothetical protein WC974_09895 [Thermoplasmata archaeon]